MKVRLDKQFTDHKGEPMFARVPMLDDNGEEVKDVKGQPVLEKRPEMIKDLIATALFSSKADPKEATQQYKLFLKVSDCEEELELTVEESNLIQKVIKAAGFSTGITAQMLIALEG